jgi:hypothetical protein
MNSLCSYQSNFVPPNACDEDKAKTANTYGGATI